MQTIWTKKSIKFGLLFWKLWLRSAQLLWRRYALHRVPSSFVWFCTSTIKSYLQESYFYSVLICFYSDSVSSAQLLIVSGRRVGNIGLWSVPDYRRRLAWCVSAELSKDWAAASGAEDSRPWGELEAKISGISAGSLATTMSAANLSTLRRAYVQRDRRRTLLPRRRRRRGYLAVTRASSSESW